MACEAHLRRLRSPDRNDRETLRSDCPARRFARTKHYDRAPVTYHQKQQDHKAPPGRCAVSPKPPTSESRRATRFSRGGPQMSRRDSICSATYETVVELLPRPATLRDRRPHYPWPIPTPYRLQAAPSPPALKIARSRWLGGRHLVKMLRAESDRNPRRQRRHWLAP